MEVVAIAVTLRLAGLRPENVAFAYSPGQEALHSLHVMADARSHPLHVQWVLRARKRFSPALKAEVDLFEHLFRARLPVLWDVRAARSLCSFADDMAALRSSSPGQFARHLLRSALEGDRPEESFADLPALCAEAASLHPASAALFALQPDQMLNRFAAMLEGYWEACLAPQWDEIESLFAADIEQRGRLLLRRGVAGALEGISPQVHLDAAGKTCIVTRSTSLEVAFSERDTLTLIPTYFAWPHLFMSPVLPDLLMAYPVLEQQQDGRAPVPPERLLKLLRAAGDTSRLQILQLIGSTPRSTGELAGLIGISEAAVSKHLKQLQEAGLVVAERQSYYVFYRAAREPVAEISRGLMALLTGE